jgi:hypothetical protein
MPWDAPFGSAAPRKPQRLGLVGVPLARMVDENLTVVAKARIGVRFAAIYAENLTRVAR